MRRACAGDQVPTPRRRPPECAAFGMGRRHRITVALENQARQQTRRLGAHAVKKGKRYRYYVSTELITGSRSEHLVPVGCEPVLHDLPQFRIDDGIVLAWVDLILVSDLAAVQAILQHQVEGAAG